MISTTYVERRRRIEAMLLSQENAGEVAAWAGANATALPDGTLLLVVQGTPLIVTPGHYVKLGRDGTASGFTGREDFEADWEPLPEDDDSSGLRQS